MGNLRKAKRSAVTGRKEPAARGAMSAGPRRWLKPALGIAAVAALGALVVFVAADVTGNPQAATDPPPGTEFFTITEFSHTTGPVQYDPEPPVGGPHDPTWLACGVYREPVRNENAVHSLEHGAVWITYPPDLDEGSVSTVEGFGRRAKVIVSPYPGLDATVVASAWGAQLRMDQVDTDLIDQFIRAFAGRAGREPAAPC